MPANPLAGFEVDSSRIVHVGHDLQRPECILAERDGTMWSADARGGVVRISADGSQRFIGQRASERFAGPPMAAPRWKPSTPRARCPTAWPSPPTATS
jgi:hypothetical protein